MGKSKRRKKLAQVIPDLLRVYRYFWRDIRKYWGLIAGSFFALICGVLFRILEPWPLKFVLDQVFEPAVESENSTVMLPEDWSTNTIIIFVAALVIGIAVMRAVSDYISRIGFFNVGNKVVIRVRDRIYRHIQSLPMAFHDNARHGDLITRVTRDVSLLRDVTATAILPLIGSSMILIGMALVMIWLNWKLAAVSLVIIPLYWLTTVRLGRQIRQTARKQREREGAMATIASQAIGNIKTIRAFELEDRFAQEFDRKNRQSQKDDLKASRLSLKLGRTVDVLLAISTATVLCIGASFVLNGQMYPGDLVVFLVYLKRSFKPAQEFAKYTARVAKATAAGERVIQILEKPVEHDPENPLLVPSFDGEIEFQNVSFGYDQQQLILKDLNLRIRAGETVAITGISGAGKSTLISLLLRFYEIRSGKILLGQQNLNEYSLAALRSRFSVVLQDPQLFSKSIAENISLGSQEKASTNQIIEAARLAEVDEFAFQMPDKLDSMVGERSTTLSRGQRQRIAIARAAISNKPIFLLDEPTTGLDENNCKIVSDALLEIAASKTTLVVTHDLRLARRCDRIVVIADGQVVQSGNHQQLVNADGPYRELLLHGELRFQADEV